MSLGGFRRWGSDVKDGFTSFSDNLQDGLTMVWPLSFLGVYCTAYLLS